MRARRIVTSLIGTALLASAVAPVGATASPTAVAAVTVVAQAADGSLPAPNDPAWAPTFFDDFRDTTMSQWDNVGTSPRGRCFTADPTWKGADVGRILIKPSVKWSSTDPSKWNCRMTSKQEFPSGTYIFAARVKLHHDEGHLSSFWLNASIGYNEIDVIENAGNKASPSSCEGKAGESVAVNRSNFNGLNSAYYSTDKPQRTGYKYCFAAAEAASAQDDGFHTVHVRYTTGQSVQYFLDGVPGLSYVPTSDGPLRLVLTNIDQQKTAFPNPKDFAVSWVQVWKQNPAPGSPGGGTTPPPPPPVCDNDCWRAQLGSEPYNYILNSNMSDPRLARIIFDRKFYAMAYPDVRPWAEGKVATQGGNFYDHVQWHWLNYGIPWGRAGSATFDPSYYMANNGDVAAAYGGATNFTGAISHFISYGRFEGRRGSTLFDAGYYRSRYGDLAGMEAWALLDHFTNNGMSEGRQGSAEFGPAFYLGQYADLRNAYGPNGYHAGMGHWYANGRAEGRKAVP